MDNNFGQDNLIQSHDLINDDPLLEKNEWDLDLQDDSTNSILHPLSIQQSNSVQFDNDPHINLNDVFDMNQEIFDNNERQELDNTQDAIVAYEGELINKPKAKKRKSTHGFMDNEIELGYSKMRQMPQKRAEEIRENLIAKRKKWQFDFDQKIYERVVQRPNLNCGVKINQFFCDLQKLKKKKRRVVPYGDININEYGGDGYINKYGADGYLYGAEDEKIEGSVEVERARQRHQRRLSTVSPVGGIRNSLKPPSSIDLNTPIHDYKKPFSKDQTQFSGGKKDGREGSISSFGINTGAGDPFEIEAEFSFNDGMDFDQSILSEAQRSNFSQTQNSVDFRKDSDAFLSYIQGIVREADSEFLYLEDLIGVRITGIDDGGVQNRRAHACKAFYFLLGLNNTGAVKLEQKKPYSDIKIVVL